MAKRKRWIAVLVIYVIVFLMFLVVPSLTSQSVYPDDLKLTREQFPLIYDFNLQEGSNPIILNEGIDLDKVYKVEYYTKGCSAKTVPKGSVGQTEQVSSFEIFDLNGVGQTISYPTCESLFYGDEQFEENKYQHYQDKTILISTTLNTRNLNINIVSDNINNIERTLKIWEYVSCTRSSQCPLILVGKEKLQPECNQDFHLCSLEELPIPNQGTKPISITEGEIKQLFTTPQYIILSLIGSGVIVFLIWLVFLRKKK